MSVDAAEQIWAAYSKVWTAITPQERAQLMRQTLAETVTYTAPDTVGAGMNDFTTVIEAFQAQFPGAYFKTQQIIEQHDQLLVTWTIHGPDGAALLCGHSYARLNAARQIEHLAGFWADF